ncbi:unnamed protein product [Amoebophrya sp. A25]|nr:unnamed protein product [Amoebophrya sp. A25]|eukprot:GSA25T00023915001.1
MNRTGLKTGSTAAGGSSSPFQRGISADAAEQGSRRLKLFGIDDFGCCLDDDPFDEDAPRPSVRPSPRSRGLNQGLFDDPFAPLGIDDAPRPSITRSRQESSAKMGMRRDLPSAFSDFAPVEDEDAPRPSIRPSLRSRGLNQGLFARGDPGPPGARGDFSRGRGGSMSRGSSVSSVNRRGGGLRGRGGNRDEVQDVLDRYFREPRNYGDQDDDDDSDPPPRRRIGSSRACSPSRGFCNPLPDPEEDANDYSFRDDVFLNDQNSTHHPASGSGDTTRHRVMRRGLLSSKKDRVVPTDTVEVRPQSSSRSRFDEDEDSSRDRGSLQAWDGDTSMTPGGGPGPSTTVAGAGSSAIAPGPGMGGCIPPGGSRISSFATVGGAGSFTTPPVSESFASVMSTPSAGAGSWQRIPSTDQTLGAGDPTAPSRGGGRQSKGSLARRTSISLASRGFFGSIRGWCRGRGRESTNLEVFRNDEEEEEEERPKEQDRE